MDKEVAKTLERLQIRLALVKDATPRLKLDIFSRNGIGKLRQILLKISQIS